MITQRSSIKTTKNQSAISPSERCVHCCSSLLQVAVSHVALCTTNSAKKKPSIMAARRKILHATTIFSIRQFSGIGSGITCRTLTVPLTNNKPRIVSHDEAVECVQSGDSVYIHGSPSTPSDLVDALARRVDSANLTDLKTHSILTSSQVPLFEPKYHDRVRANVFFANAFSRPYIKSGDLDYTPVFLQDIIKLFDQKIVQTDVALLTVSPPDDHGYCSLGVSVDCTSAAARNTKRLVGAINPSQPRTYGDSQIHVSQFEALTESDAPILEVPKSEPNAVEMAIGKLIANELIHDFDTLQMGIGTIPDAVLSQLTNHKELGVHTELVCSGVVPLIEKGVITNSRKSLDRGKIVTSFAMGDRPFYDLINENSLFVFASSAYTNNYNVIAAQSQIAAINSAIEVDLTGQVVAESIGESIYSGFGGQTDFIHAAAQASDGKGRAIIALPSRTAKSKSRIVPVTAPGAGVVTTRGHVRFVVTEFGIADLFGKSLRQRAHALIQIAHPDDRQSLEEAAFKRFKVKPSA